MPRLKPVRRHWPTFRDLSHVGDAIARVGHQRCAALDGRWRLASGNALELVRRVRPCPDLLPAFLPTATAGLS